MATTGTTNDRWNPFSWRAAELARLGDTPTDQRRRTRLEDELVMAEADEAARGAAHLSIVHGDPATLERSIHLDRFYDTMKRLVAKAEVHRLRIDVDHVIIAVSGHGAQESIDEVVGVAELMNPGHWRITRTVRPDLSPAG